MTLTDTWLLAKKIFIGIVITVVPLFIMAGGLWITQRVEGSHGSKKQGSAKQTSSAEGVRHAN